MILITFVLLLLFVTADVDATVTMKKEIISEDETSEKVCDINVDFNIGGASVQLDNLFNDPDLSIMMNKFLNTNWREITAEIRPAMGTSIENILHGIAKQLNEMYDLNKLFDE